MLQNDTTRILYVCKNIHITLKVNKFKTIGHENKTRIN